MARRRAADEPPAAGGVRRPRAAPGWGGARVLALGHSTRPIEELIALLASNAVRTLADIRTVPRSRHNPQFDGRALAASLAGAGVAYAWIRELGGLRRPRRDSENGAWRNESFRGYADHMASPEFADGLRALAALARQGPVAVLCAEAVPWRCHRSLLADALWARGVGVEHIVGTGRTRPHRLTPFARVEGRRVTYPPLDNVGRSSPSAASRSRASYTAAPPRSLLK